MDKTASWVFRLGIATEVVFATGCSVYGLFAFIDEGWGPKALLCTTLGLIFLRLALASMNNRKNDHQIDELRAKIRSLEYQGIVRDLEKS